MKSINKDKIDETNYDESRMKNRQTGQEEAFSDNEINKAYEDLITGLEDLQIHSLNFFISALESDKSKEIVNKYGNNAIDYFINLSQFGSEEIQSLALSCVELFYNHGDLDVSNISNPEYVQFLIQNKLMTSIPEANKVLSILSIDAAEDDESITTMFENNILGFISELPPETGYGELIYIILPQIDQESPQINDMIILVLRMLESPNPDNICNGLKCINFFISNDMECFDFDAFHSSFPQFLLSGNELIVPLAFDILSNEKFPSNENDINAVFQCLANGGPTSLFAIKYLIKTSESWMENPPPEIFNGLMLSIPTFKYNNVEFALQLLVPSLRAPGIEFNPGQIQLLSDFLCDKSTGKFIIFALNIIWERIQSQEDNSWFTEELAKHDLEIDEMTNDQDEELSTAASRLLDIIS